MTRRGEGLSRLIAGAALCGVATVASGQQPGIEFHVNSYATNAQTAPAVAVDADGNYVVVWESAGQDGDREGIFARRYDALDNPLGPEFQVNSYTTYAQRAPAIAMRPSGEFVVVWQSFGQDDSFGGVFGQLFDASGTPMDPEFRVNAITANAQRDPAIAMDAGGNFIVVWQGYRPADEATGWHIWGRRFDFAGNPLDTDFRVNRYQPPNLDGFLTGRRKPGVAMDAAGNFVVVWESYNTGGGSGSTQARLFDSSGTPVTGVGTSGEFTVAFGQSENPRVAMNAVGGFMVVWNTFRSAGARPFDSSGVPLRTEFVVDSAAYCTQTSVAVDDAGQFVVAWGRGSYRYLYDEYGYAWGFHVRTRRYDAEGNAVGPSTRASTKSRMNKERPAIAARTPGQFIVAWESAAQDGSDFGVFARNSDVIFADGFETNAFVWSSVATDGGDLSLRREAAITSPDDYGMQVVVDDQTNLLVQDNTPNAEPRYRARFYLDPNGFDPGEAVGRRRQLVFLALSEAPLKRLVMILLRRIDGQYAIGVQVLRDDDTLAKPSFFPVSDGPHAIEFDWQKATAPGANDGRFDLWVDGTPAIVVTGLDNDQRSVDLVRMGALSVKAGASGTLFFDEFVSRRLAYIGP